MDVYAPLSRIPEIAALPGVKQVSAEYRPITSAGSVQSEWPAIANLPQLDQVIPGGADGSGVKIGIISDSFDFLRRGAVDTTQASGDLPPDDHLDYAEDMVQTGVNFGSDEGRAMAEVAYDAAPGSSIQFWSQTIFDGEAAYAEAIDDLSNPAFQGANLIASDVNYFTEAAFQDDVIAQAVQNAVSTRHVPFIDAAGNSGGRTWYGTYSDGAVLNNQLAFDGDADEGLAFVVGQQGGHIDVALHWAEPLQGAINDFDISLVDSVGHVLASNASNQIGGQPVTTVSYTNLDPHQRLVNIRIKFSNGTGPVDGLPMFLVANSSLTWNPQDDEWGSGPQIFGAANSAYGMSVGAVPSANPLTIEPSSSHGGGVPIRFNPNGTPIANAANQRDAVFSIDGPNATLEGATFSSFGTSTIAGTLSNPYDADYFGFTVPTNYQVANGLQIGAAFTGGLDGVISVFDVAGNQLARVDTFGGNGDELLNGLFFLPGGSYVLRVGAFNGASSGNYEVHLRASVPTLPGGLTNGTPTFSATSVIVPSGGNAASLNNAVGSVLAISNGSVVGYYFGDDPQITGSNITINASSSAFDTVIAVYAYDGYFGSTQPTLVSLDDDGGGGTNSRITFTPVAGVRYVLAVTSFSSTGGGAYRIDVNYNGSPSTQPIPLNGLGDGSFVINNLAATDAQTLSFLAPPELDVGPHTITLTNQSGNGDIYVLTAPAPSSTVTATAARGLRPSPSPAPNSPPARPTTSPSSQSSMPGLSRPPCQLTCGRFLCPPRFPTSAPRPMPASLAPTTSPTTTSWSLTLTFPPPPRSLSACSATASWSTGPSRRRSARWRC